MKLQRILFLLLFMAAFSANAQEAIKQLAVGAQIAEDRESDWTATDVKAGQHDDEFRPIKEKALNLGFTTSTYWVKFTANNPTESKTEYYLETARPITNKVNLYEVSNEEKAWKSGDDLPFEERPFHHKDIIFPIELEAGESKDFLLEVGSDGEVITLPIKQWPTHKFDEYVQGKNLSLGLYYGLLLFVVGLFLFFALVVKQRIYTYYVAYVAFLVIMQASLDGLSFQYLWPNSIWLANHAILIFSSTSVFALMLYASEFLKVNGMPSWFKYSFRSLQAIVGICILMGMGSGAIYETAFPLINGMSLLALILIISGIFWNRQNDNQISLLFGFGFISVLLGGMLFILTNFSIIDNDFIAENAIKLGSVAEVTFLSLAMVGRYRDIQKEKEAAQEEAFENLKKLNSLVKEQNTMLEHQVAERTAELQEKNQEIIDSITYAKRIQEAILPPMSLVKSSLPECFVLYKPKDIVAGDFYWLEPVDDVVFFAAADCTGHGVPGAMVSVVCSNALNRAVREFALRSPSEILDKTLELVIERFERSEEEVKDGMDIALCAYNRKTQELMYSGANNALWIVTKREIDELNQEVKDRRFQHDDLSLFEIKADKQPIGKYHDPKPYTNHKLNLQKGDCIYLYSDGYADQFGGEKGKKFKYKPMKQLVVANSALPMNQQHDELDRRFEEWKGELEQIDDVCIIGIRA